MGRVSQQQFNQPEDPVQWNRFVSLILDQLIGCVNSGLNFKDNFKCNIVNVYFEQASQAVSVPHTLNQIPSGYVVLSRNQPMVIYNDTDAFTTTSIALRSTMQGTITVLIV